MIHISFFNLIGTWHDFCFSVNNDARGIRNQNKQVNIFVNHDAGKNRNATFKTRVKQSAKKQQEKGFFKADTHVLRRSYLRVFPAGQHLAVAPCSQWTYHRSSRENILASRSWCILLIWERDWERTTEKQEAKLNNSLHSNWETSHRCTTALFILWFHD